MNYILWKTFYSKISKKDAMKVKLIDIGKNGKYNGRLNSTKRRYRKLYVGA